MTVLRYKDYQGAVRYEDGHLVIQILHISDFITAQCDSALQAQRAFEELVDDYLATCAELKKAPSKPFKGSFNVRMSPELHKRVAMSAAEGGDTLNGFVVRALEAYLDKGSRVGEELSAGLAHNILSAIANRSRQHVYTRWEPRAADPPTSEVRVGRSEDIRSYFEQIVTPEVLAPWMVVEGRR